MSINLLKFFNWFKYYFSCLPMLGYNCSFWL